MSKISEPKSEPVLNKEPAKNISKLKASRSGIIDNLTKCINCVLFLTDNIRNYDEVCLLCNCRLNLQFLTLLKCIAL